MSDSKLQPKINQRLMIRSAILMFLFAGFVVAYQFYFRHKDDWNDLVKTDTNGWVAAIEYGKSGSRVVAIKPDGKIVKDDGYTENAADRDLVWSPDGNFMFFVSDRVIPSEPDNRTVNVYRWTPAHAKAEPRTLGGRSRGNPSFPTDPEFKDSKSPLIVSGGETLELDPHDQKTTTILPPRGREIARGGGEGDDKGTDNPFSAAYGQLGTSFRVAKWAKHKQWIAAVMRRDQGEVLVCQNMDPKSPSPPIPLIAGLKIEIEIEPSSGNLIFCVRDFQWVDKVPEQFIKNGRATRPYAHVIGTYSFEKDAPPRMLAAENVVAFGGIAPSPDGKTLLFTVGPYSGDGTMTPKGLVALPLTGDKPTPVNLARGEIYDPSWHPSGSQILFAKRVSADEKAIYRILRDGSNETKLTTGGVYGSPKFSPQSL